MSTSSPQLRCVDSPLGRWTHSEWSPAHLTGIVESISYFEGEPAHPRERVFPHGRVELIVHLAERYSVVNGTRAEICPVACVTGLISSSMVVQAPPGGSRVLGVRLHPAGARAQARSASVRLTSSPIALPAPTSGSPRRAGAGGSPLSSLP